MKKKKCKTNTMKSNHALIISPRIPFIHMIVVIIMNLQQKWVRWPERCGVWWPEILSLIHNNNNNNYKSMLHYARNAQSDESGRMQNICSNDRDRKNAHQSKMSQRSRHVILGCSWSVVPRESVVVTLRAFHIMLSLRQNF